MTHPANILLVDDNRMDVELVLDAMRESGLRHGVAVARSGQEALDYLQGAGRFADRGAFPLPDLVLLDLKMPGLDGFEVLRRIKSQSGIGRLPVLVLTSSRLATDRARSYDCGANGYLEKPASLDGYIEMVRAITGYWIDLNLPPPLA